MPKVLPSVNPNASQSRRGFHRLATFAKCPRAYAFRYLSLLVPLKTSKPLAMGTLIHEALMHHYRARIGVEASDPIEAMRRMPARVAWVFELARFAFQRWKDLWAPAKDFKRIIAVEHEFEAQLGDEVFTARVDLVIQGDDNRCYFLDHKSCGGDVKKNHLNFLMSGQLALHHKLGERLAAKGFGLPFGGVLIHSVSTSGSEDVAWVQPSVMSQMWRDDVVASTKAVSDAVALADTHWDEDPWAYEVRPESCRGRYGWCDYMALCKRGQMALGEFCQAVDRATDAGEGAGE